MISRLRVGWLVAILVGYGGLVGAAPVSGIGPIPGWDGYDYDALVAVVLPANNAASSAAVGTTPTPDVRTGALLANAGPRTAAWSSTPPVLDFRAAKGADEAAGGVRLLGRGSPELSQQRLEHIAYRHFATSDAPRAGKFASGTSVRDLRGLIDETAQSGTFRPNTGGRPGHIYERTFGSPIGTSAQGNATSRLRVVVNDDGQVVTAFPY